MGSFVIIYLLMKVAAVAVTLSELPEQVAAMHHQQQQQLQQQQQQQEVAQPVAVEAAQPKESMVQPAEEAMEEQVEFVAAVQPQDVAVGEPMQVGFLINLQFSNSVFFIVFFGDTGPIFSLSQQMHKI